MIAAAHTTSTETAVLLPGTAVKPAVARYRGVCSCGETSGWFSASGFAAGWEAAHLDKVGQTIGDEGRG